jgi:hypothetical protein
VRSGHAARRRAEILAAGFQDPVDLKLRLLAELFGGIIRLANHAEIGRAVVD